MAARRRHRALFRLELYHLEKSRHRRTHPAGAGDPHLPRAVFVPAVASRESPRARAGAGRACARWVHARRFITNAFPLIPSGCCSQDITSISFSKLCARRVVRPLICILGSKGTATGQRAKSPGTQYRTCSHAARMLPRLVWEGPGPAGRGPPSLLRPSPAWGSQALPSSASRPRQLESVAGHRPPTHPNSTAWASARGQRIVGAHEMSHPGGRGS